QATAQSYAEQALFRSPFWNRPAAPPAPPPGGRPWPSLGRPLALAAPLRQVAVLDGDRIRWAPAIWLHHSAEAVPRLGPLTAARLADLLDAPAPVATLSARLERAIGPGPAQAILRRLMDEGALAPAGQAGMPAPSSA
ncbi:MAG TPA: hypothetical protein VLA78_01805, partial [Paracoccaceae bacterium]|nr:hypothetical protein [Paracoccaceae bacterium]